MSREVQIMSNFFVQRLAFTKLDHKSPTNEFIWVKVFIFKSPISKTFS